MVIAPVLPFTLVTPLLVIVVPETEIPVPALKVIAPVFPPTLVTGALVKAPRLAAVI